MITRTLFHSKTTLLHYYASSSFSVIYLLFAMRYFFLFSKSALSVYYQSYKTLQLRVTSSKHNTVQTNIVASVADVTIMHIAFSCSNISLHIVLRRVRLLFPIKLLANILAFYQMMKPDLDQPVLLEITQVLVGESESSCISRCHIFVHAPRCFSDFPFGP